jgi:hypothetical protein
MNPFQQQVIDSTMRQLDEQADKARQGDAARAIQSGALVVVVKAFKEQKEKRITTSKSRYIIQIIICVIMHKRCKDHKMQQNYKLDWVKHQVI